MCCLCVLKLSLISSVKSEETKKQLAIIYKILLPKTKMFDVLNILLCVAVLWVPQCTATELSVRSSIVDVAVLKSVAMITRKFTIDAASIPHDSTYLVVSLDGLPSSMVDTSVRIYGTGPAQILGSEISERSVDRSQSEAYTLHIKEANIIKSQLTIKLSKLSLEESRLRSKEKLLLLLVESTFSAGSPAATASEKEKEYPDITKARDMLLYMDTELAATHKRLLLIQSGQATLGEAQSVIDTAINTLSSQGAWTFPKLECSPSSETAVDSCIVNVITDPDSIIRYPQSVIEKKVLVRLKLLKRSPGSSLDFTVDYMTSPASWSPEYDLQVEGDGSEEKKYKIAINYYAAVTQKTGEDWVNVSLSLSTANAAQIDTPPVPQEKGVYFQQPIAYAMDMNLGARMGSTSERMPRMKMAMARDAGASMVSEAMNAPGTSTEIHTAAPLRGMFVIQHSRGSNDDGDGSIFSCWFFWW